MPETLQTTPGQLRWPENTVRPTELILDDEFCGKVIEFVRDAKSEIRICAYRWFWYEQNPEIPIQKLNVELMRAIARGVKIRAICDREEAAAALRSRGIDARSLESQRLMHTKAFGIDCKTLVIGSHNLTKRAGQSNFEMSLATQEPQVILAYIDYFDKLW